MLQVARLAPTLLQSSTDLVGGFFRERYDPGGGFANRAGLPDLYYTVFGLEGLAALRAPIDADAHARAISPAFGDGASLDFVHLSCLARCWANLPDGVPPADAAGADARPRGRPSAPPTAASPPIPAATRASAYGAFVALGAYQDLREPVPDSDAPDGAAPDAASPPTAASTTSPARRSG